MLRAVVVLGSTMMGAFTPTVAQAWLLLFVAGLLEVGWAVGMKSTHGFTRWGPTVFVLVTALMSFYLLALAMKTLPVGTAYAVWVGIGAVGAAALGVGLLGETASLPRVASILLIVAGVAGLRLFSDG
jgi:quaternary ammonium compound-resistance protein SugE